MTIGDVAEFAATNVTLDNVWICTTHPNNEPLTVTEDLGLGGCLGGLIDVGMSMHEQCLLHTTRFL